MKAGDMGEEDRESGQSSPEGDKMQISLCDVSSEDFFKNLANTKRAPWQRATPTSGESNQFEERAIVRWEVARLHIQN